MIQLYDETWQYIVRLRHTARRSEFMPFAPATRIEDAEICYKNCASLKKYF